MLSCEGTGKNIEQAINNALLELKASREDVDIKILNEGGFLKKAKVLVSISEDAKEKYLKREELKKQDNFAENFIKAKISEEENKIKIVTDEEYVKVEKDVEIFNENKTDSVIEETKEVKFSDKFVDAEEFLNKVLTCLDLKADISKEEDGRYIRYQLTGDGLNDLIGRHGECLYALSAYMGAVCKNEDRKKVVLDIEHYRDKRADTLQSLAKKVADKVAKSGRYYKFEPMVASERKVIHTALQEDDRVTTLSKGEEPRRYLIVFPKEYRD